jgi:WD40 repeat protein
MIHFSPDGSLIAGGDQQRGTRVWDVASGELIVELPATSDVMYWSAWTPYGTRLLTGCPEPHGTLCLWQIPSGDLIWQTNEAEFVDVRALAFNPHGSLLASAASNTTGIILDAATGQVLKQLDLYYNNQTVALAWSSDGAQLASIAQDGSLRFWGLSSSAGIHLPPLVTITPTPTGTITLLPPTFTPASPTSIPTATQRPTATPIPVLHIGGRATVYVINNDTLNVRTEPAIETNILERLDIGAVVTLLDGPRDTNGYRWWRVRTAQGTEGWAVESADGIQTLIPLAD